MNMLLALALLLQETPAEVFQKIEAAIEGARTIKVEFTVDASAKDAVASKGFLSVEEGKTRFSVELKSTKSATVGMSLDSDGRKVVSTLATHTMEVDLDPKLGRSNLNMYFGRLGMLTGHLFQHGFWMGSSSRGREAVSLDLKQMFAVQNPQFGGDGKDGTKSLTYDIKTAFQPSPLDRAKIWYDPKTYKIVRREYQLKDKGKGDTIFEDYTEVELGDEKAPAATGVKEKPSAPAPIPDSELDTLFFKAKLQVAESHLKAGKKTQAVEALEDVIKTYPKHSLVPEARRLLEEARKK